MNPGAAVAIGAILGAIANYCLMRWRGERRRTRDILMGYGAGKNAVKLPPMVDVCTCGHPFQEHLKFPTASGHRCLGTVVSDNVTDDARVLDRHCLCENFNHWYVDGERGSCECGSREFRDVTLCLHCARWQ